MESELSTEISQIKRILVELKSQSQNKITELTSQNKYLLSTVEFEKGKNAAIVTQNQKLKEQAKKLSNQNMSLQMEAQKLILQIQIQNKLQKEPKEYSIKRQTELKENFSKREKELKQQLMKQQKELKQSYLKRQQELMDCQMKKQKEIKQSFIKQQNKLKETIRKLQEEGCVKEIQYNEKISKQRQMNIKSQQQIKAMHEIMTQHIELIKVQREQINGLKSQTDVLTIQNKQLQSHIDTLRKVQQEKMRLDEMVVEKNSRIRELQDEQKNMPRPSDSMNEEWRGKFEEQRQKWRIKLEQWRCSYEKLMKLMKQLTAKNKQQQEELNKQLSDKAKQLTVYEKVSNEQVDQIAKLQQQLQMSRQSQKRRAQELQILKKETQARSIEINKRFKVAKEELQAQISTKGKRIEELEQQLILAQRKVSILKGERS